MNKKPLHYFIARKLSSEAVELKTQWKHSSPTPHFLLDHIFPESIADALAAQFPNPKLLIRNQDPREHKYVGNHTDRYTPLITECLMAFQHPEVLKQLEEITGYVPLFADPTLYASGVSSMGQDDFLNPHLDNSHDGISERYRCLNALYYVTENWQEEWGGSLELWQRGLKQKTTIPAFFNRLVIMETGKTSWHSVNKVVHKGFRNCISNYYFVPVHRQGKFRHVTSFYGRPREKIKRAYLFFDRAWRNGVGKILPNTVLERLQQNKR